MATNGQAWAQELRRRAEEAKAERKEKRVAKAAHKGPRECACGCGTMTKGGVFAPGHDSQLHSAFLMVWNGKADLEGAPREIADLFVIWNATGQNLKELVA